MVGGYPEAQRLCQRTTHNTGDLEFVVIGKRGVDKAFELFGRGLGNDIEQPRGSVFPKQCCLRAT